MDGLINYVIWLYTDCKSILIAITAYLKSVTQLVLLLFCILCKLLIKITKQSDLNSLKNKDYKKKWFLNVTEWIKTLVCYAGKDLGLSVQV